MTSRVRQLRVLVPPTARATDWFGPIAGATLAVVLQTVAAPRAPALAPLLVAIALALGVSFAFDDPAAPSLAASPTPLALRHGVRAACVLPLPTVVWLPLALLSHYAGTGTRTLELAVLLATVLAVAAVGVRVGDCGGSVAAPALLALIAAAALLPPDISLLPAGPQPNGGMPVALRWTAVLGIAAATWMFASIDPARPRRRRLPWREGIPGRYQRIHAHDGDRVCVRR